MLGKLFTFSIYLKKVDKLLRLISLTFLFTILSHGAHADVFAISSFENRYLLNSHIQVLPDPEGSITIEQVLSPDYLFSNKKNVTLKKGVKQHWVKISIKNQLKDIVNWHLWVYPMQYNEVYMLKDASLSLIAKNGIYMKSSESCFPENPQVITLNIASDEELTLFIRVNTSTPQEYKPRLELELRPAHLEMKRYVQSWIVLAVLAGVLVSLSFYIFFQYFLFRDKSFLYFFLGFFSMAMYFLTFDRVAYAVFNSDYITRFTGNYFALICTFSYIGFTRFFLDPEERLKTWHKTLRLLQLFYVVPFILIVLVRVGVFWNITPYVHSIHIVAFGFLLSFAVVAYRKKHAQAGHYLISNVVFFIFLCLFIYYVQNKPNVESYSTLLLASSLKIGSMGQVLLFTLAMANRFGKLSRQVVEKQLENEKLEKQQILEIQKIITNINQELEVKVIERTAEINHQKEELRTQAENLETAYHEISHQKKLIEQTHSQITDSLFYAAMIQQAVLPKQSFMKHCFDEHFSIFWPRDIVSGDFYWVTQIDDITLFAIADCTGHGVPGAFMSMLGTSLLNEIVKRDHITKPSEILNNLRVHLVNALQQETTKTDIPDGIDIAVCTLRKNNSGNGTEINILEYAGAHCSGYIARKALKVSDSDLGDTEIIEQNGFGTLLHLKPDIMGISSFLKKDSFANKTITLKKGDMIYLYTDGLTDQIGGPEYKKFSNHRFRKLLLELSNSDIKKQQQTIERELVEWMNHPDPISGSPSDQIDDICLLGIRIN
jgi:serine phosphatase RsbU (regulator of sigma subunit)